MKGSGKKKAPAGDRVALSSLRNRDYSDQGRYVTTPDGRRWRCAWPTVTRGRQPVVDGWFLREELGRGRSGKDVVWFAGDVQVAAEPRILAPQAAKAPEIDPLLALVDHLPLWEERP